MMESSNQGDPFDRRGAHRPFARDHGVVIGIDAYENGVAPLRTAVADARALARALSRDHHYEVDLRLDAAADGRDLVELFETELPARVGSGDRLTLYFAGHGVAMGDGDGHLLGYLLPRDARPGDESSWFAMERLRAALERLPCRHLLVILDCCFAGSFRWAPATRSFAPTGEPLYESQLERFLSGTAWQVLTSAAHDQRALDVAPGHHNHRDEDPGEIWPGAAAVARPGHSPFAAALLAGLAGAADSSRSSFAPDGVITATELHQYVAEVLFGERRRDPARQTPGLWPLKPENTGEYVFESPVQETRLRPDPALDESANPWRGLSHYGEDDASVFFGRGRVVRQLHERLEEAEDGVVALVGASGTGKSSLIRAGLLPRLRTSGGDVALRLIERLGEDPRATLAAAAAELDAATEPTRLLLIDQFEEIFTQCPDPERRAAFLEALEEWLRCGGRGERSHRLLLALRSDFEPSFAAHPFWAAALARGRFPIPAMGREELRQILLRPAQQKALYFEPPGLVEQILDQVTAMPSALPLVSFVLAETYRQAVLRRRRDATADRFLSAADLASAGGVAGVLHQRAGALCDEATPAERETVRRMFLRMVSTAGGQLGRRRVDRRELEFEEPAEARRVAAVLERFTAARLLVADETWVEPAHDTLILAWDRLIGWRVEHGASLPLLHTAWRAAEDWRAAGEDPALLWDRDPRLPQLEILAGELNRLELAFVRASRRRRRMRRRLAWGGLAAGGAAMASLTWHALRQARLARQRLRDAVATADEIITTVDLDLEPIAGTAAVRRRLLNASSRLLDRLQSGAGSDAATLHSRIASHLRRGELALSHDDLATVEREYGAALVLARRFAELMPRHPRARHDLALVHGKFGGLARAMGKLKRATELHAEERRLLLALVDAVQEGTAAEPDWRWRRDLAISCNRLGAVAEAEGRLAAARSYYQEGLTHKRHLADEIGEPELAPELFISYDKLGGVSEASGELEEARQWYERGLELKRRLAAAEPRDARWSRALAFSCERLGDLARASGGTTAARRFYQEAVERRRELLGADPGNILWRRDLVLVCQRLGDLWRELEDAGAARRLYEEATAAAGAMVEADPHNPLWQRRLEECRRRLADLDSGNGVD